MIQVTDRGLSKTSVTPAGALNTVCAPPPMDFSHIVAKALQQDVLTAAQIAFYAAPQGQRNLRNVRFLSPHPLELHQGESAVRSARVDYNIRALTLSKQLSQDKTTPNPEQQTILARYTGWGGLTRPLVEPGVTSALKEFVTPEELGQLKAGILNAHYTPPKIVSFVYDCLARLGAKPLRILDPCTAIGGFFGHLPEALAKDAELVGCEIDENSARIAKLLFPDAAIEVKPFEKMKLPDNYFDLVVGNVPFGDYPVFDPETPNVRHLIHNAFFAKAMRKVKSGGLIAFITSTGTMDSTGEQTRRLLSSECNLIAAFRLSNATFSTIASIGISSDLLILQKRAPGEASNILDWIDSVRMEVNGANTVCNEWWANHPASVLGQPTLVSSKFGLKYGCLDNEVAPFLERALDTLQPLNFNSQDDCKVANWADWLLTRHLQSKTEGSWVFDDDVLMRIANGKPEGHNLSDLQASRVTGMLQLSTALHALLTQQAMSSDDSHLPAPRGKANMLYDLFVKKHGPVNAAVNRRLFFRDPTWPLLSASEIYDEETKVAIKSDIYSCRTVNPVLAPKPTDCFNQALATSAAYKLKVDADFMGQLMNKPGDDVIATLAKTERIYWCPENQEWQLSERYLSGAIVQKIAAATQSLYTDPRMQCNIQALEKALPERMGIHDIQFQMGSTFIGVELIDDFVLSLFGVQRGSTFASRIKVKYFSAQGKWTVIGPRIDQSAAQTSYGTLRVNVLDVIHKALNGANITIYDRVETEEGTRSVPNSEETGLAREKLFELKEAFDKWIRSDVARAEVVEGNFNRQFRSYKAPTYDGAHLVVPGLNPNINLRPHQKNGIWRSLVGGNTLAAHGVGAGKTLLAICVAQMRRQMGLCRTNLIAVPGHLLMQFAGEYMRAFPLAKLLLIGSKDMGEHAATTLAKIATGNYDSVICVHSVYTAIPVGEADIAQWRTEMFAQLDADASQATDVNEQKAVERQKKMASEMMDRYEHRQKKDMLTWGELGIDSLIIDESQAFKNLHFSTSLTNIAGLNMTFSLRAFDCFIKTRLVQVANNEHGGVLFTTATPITNTVAEMFHLMRFLMLPKLQEIGMANFDQWRANFGKTITAIEQLPEGGGFRMQTRFASFDNVLSLMELFWSFADVVLREDLDIPTPKLIGGKPQVVEIERTENQVLYMESLVERAKLIRGPKENRPSPKEDNMLCVTTDGRKAALDMRLIDRSFPDEPGSKLNVAVRHIYQIWHDTQSQRLTQMVFCDMGTPGGSTFCVYDDMRDKLVAMGVPAGEIAYAHSANTDAQKLTLWQKLNKGIIRIAFGSTAKMGTGVNAQEKLVAKHDLDAPYRPDEVEQRDGRILRQGNSNAEVWISRYVTRRTFDAYIWQLLETKLRFILQVMSGKSRVNTFEDIESRAMSFAEVKALATGNPMLIQRAKLQQQESDLMLKRKSHQNTVADAARNLRLAMNLLPFQEQAVANIQADMQILRDNHAPVLVVQGQSYSGENLRTDGGVALTNAVMKSLAFASPSSIRAIRSIKLGVFRGLPLELQMVINGSCIEPVFVLHGSHEWDCHAGESAVGNVTRLVHLAKRAEDFGPSEANSRLASTRRDIAQFRLILETPFALARELNEVCSARQALEIELGIAEEDNSGMNEQEATTTVTE